VRKVQQQLAQLKRQQRETAESAVEKVRLKSEAKVSVLEAELERMRGQSETLKKRLRTAADRHEAEQAAVGRDMAQLKRDAESSHRCGSSSHSIR
jgi:chromosome segregation ATPase